jgi:hypothetical protein
MAISCSDSKNGNLVMTYNSYDNVACTAPASGSGPVVTYTPCESFGDGTYGMYSCSTGEPAITQPMGTEYLMIFNCYLLLF